MFKKLALLLSVMYFVSNPAAQADVFLSDGLIAYYSFSGSANDDSGNGNDLNVFGAELVADRFGNQDSAYHFDGVDDYMQNSDPTGLPYENAPRSVTAWIYSEGETTWPSSSDQLYQTIVSWGAPLTPLGVFGIERGGDPSNPYNFDDKIFVLDWESNFAGSTIIEFNTWYHVAVTFDGSKLEIFVNGVTDGHTEKTYSTVDNDFGIRVGLEPPNDGWHSSFNGYLDEIRIYDKALTAAEVGQIYNYTGQQSIVPEPSTVFLFGSGLLGVLFVLRRGQRIKY